MNDHVDGNRKKETLFNISLDSFSKYLDVNLTALFSVCREFGRNNKNGTIVNFSATTGIVSARPDLYNGSHKHAGYSVSKAGVINLTKYLATHLGPSIRVNCIAPGGVKFKQDLCYTQIQPLEGGKRWIIQDDTGKNLMTAGYSVTYARDNVNYTMGSEDFVLCARQKKTKLC